LESGLFEYGSTNSDDFSLSGDGLEVYLKDYNGFGIFSNLRLLIDGYLRELDCAIICLPVLKAELRKSGLAPLGKSGLCSYLYYTKE
jgi:hypothetical protein